MRGIWIALILIAANSALADSQPAPTKAPKIVVEKKTENQIESKDTADKNQVQTTKAVIALPEKQSTVTVELDNQHTKHTGEEGTEFWPTFLGIKLKVTDSLLALFTFLLFIATIGLWLSTRKLWKAGERQAALIQKQIHLAREEFISTNRPRIILREAYTAPDVGQPIMVTYMLANTGGTKASIVGSTFGFGWSLFNGTKRQVEIKSSNAGGITQVISKEEISPDIELEGGAHLISQYIASESWTSERAKNVLVNEEGTTIITSDGQQWNYFFYGRVAYKDGLGLIRHMAFYRMLDHRSYRFTPINDPQLEYSDERA